MGAATPRVALVAGATGRLGERLLNEVIARGRYAKVLALAETRMALGIAHLELALRESLEADDTLPHVDDVYLLPDDEHDPLARSHFGRDGAFTRLDDTLAVWVARRAAAAGASRLLLVHPVPAWQQISRLQHGLVSSIERDIASQPIESVVVLRPTRSARVPGGNLVQRLVHAYLSVQLLMLPRSMPLVTSAHLARVAVDAMLGATPGTTLVGAERIAHWFDEDRAAAR